MEVEADANTDVEVSEDEGIGDGRVAELDKEVELRNSIGAVYIVSYRFLPNTFPPQAGVHKADLGRGVEITLAYLGSSVYRRHQARILLVSSLTAACATVQALPCRTKPCRRQAPHRAQS